MGMREVWIAIRGKEDVSGAAKKAGSSLQSLGSQAKSLLENQLVQGIGFAGMVAGLGKAVDAANELNASTRKVEATAKITGVALDVLQSISAKGQSAFKLNATLANDFAVELAKLATKAGDVGKAAPGMEAFLDLGAARGLSAADTLKAVQQAILGIDEGTDKLFGKNPSVIYAEFAATIGTTAGKLTDQQKAMSILTEAMEDGGKVRGEYARYLQTTAGQQEQLTNALRTSAAELGQALTPALLAVLPVITEFVGGLSNFVKGIQAMAIDAGFAFQRIAPWIDETLGKLKVAIGNWLSSNRVLMTVFGDGISRLGEDLANEGTKQIVQAGKTRRVLTEAQEDAWKELVGIQGGYQVKSEGAARGHQVTVTKLTAEELAKRKAAEETQAKALADAHEKWNRESLAQLQKLGQWLGQETRKQHADAKESAEQLASVLGVNLGEASARALQLTTAAMARLLEQLRGKIPIEQWQALNAAVQQHKRDLSDLLPPADALAESAKEAAAANARMADEVKAAKPSVADIANHAGTLARGFLDAAQAAGLLDSNMASALNSVVNIATALPKALQGDASSIVAVVSGLANIITGLKDNPAEKMRREVLTKNSDAIARLTREIGNFNIGTSGRAFQGINEVFNAGLGDRAKKLEGESLTRRQMGALQIQSDIKKALLAKGLSQKDAEDLFAQIGAPELSKIFTTNDATLILKLVPQILAALGSTEFGQFGKSFGDQLQALTEGFGVYGTEDADNKLVAFAALAQKFSPALGAALSGDLSTPEGRAAATKNLQGLFEKLKSGGLSASEIGVSGPEFLNLITQILPLLAGANGVLQSGLPVTGPQTTGTGSTVPTLPNTNTFSLPSPEVRGGLGVPGGTTTTNNVTGDFIFNFPDVTDSREAAEAVASRVSEILGARYYLQRQTQGAL